MTTTPLEDRLAAALDARADLVRAAALGPAALPATPPATVTVLRRRTAPVLAVVAAAAVAVVATVVVRDAGGDPEPSLPLASDPVSTTTTVPVDPPLTLPGSGPVGGAPAGLLPEDDPAWVGPGRPVRFASGATGTIDGDDLVLDDGQAHRVGLGELTARGRASARLSGVEVQLGQAGVGYLVSVGEEEARLVRLYAVNADGVLGLVATPGDVPFGSGFTAAGRPYLTWTTGDGARLYTRVSAGTPDQQRYEVYRWEAEGPGEGGGADGTTTLVASEVGTVCFDFEVNTYESC